MRTISLPPGESYGGLIIFGSGHLSERPLCVLGLIVECTSVSPSLRSRSPTLATLAALRAGFAFDAR